jgi:5-methyltetrahydropteroyltriglutamate--homocysteine methyltransferase
MSAQPGVRAYQHGIFPRSESVVQATRDIERGRTTQQEVDEVFAADREAYLRAQREAGLDFISDGLLRWQDLFRPLVESTDGLDARVLVRWFDNNSFFRAPEVLGELGLQRLPAWFEENGIPEPRVATLPSPYLFSRAAQPDGDRDRLMGTLAGELLAPAAARLVEAGATLVHLEEPWLAYHGIEERSWEPFRKALAAMREAIGEATLILHLYYGDAAPHAERLRDLPVDAVGIDFAETDLEDLPHPWGTGLVAGCMDGRRSLVEPADQTSAFVRRLAERLQPSELFLSSGSDLELLGSEVAALKVRALGDAARALREEGG